MNLTELHRYTDMLVICISTNTQVKITMTIMLYLELLEYVSVRKLDNKYCFNNYLNFEIGTSKSIILFKTFHILALTFVNDLEPCGTLKRLLHLVL